MKKFKRESARKRQQRQRQAFIRLGEIVRRFSTEQWLHLIRTIDMKSMASIEEYQYKGEFLVLVADTALRLSKPDVKAKNPKPSSVDLKAIISLFFSYDPSPSKLIKDLGVAAIPLFAKWQNIFNYPPTNMLGRMHHLYEDFHEDIEEMIGLCLLDLHIIVLAIYGVYADKEFIFFKADALYSPKVGSLSEDKIKKFLDFFAIDINGYHEVAKAFGVYDNQVGKFNLMNRYPIIKIDEDRYILPSKDQLLESVAANLYNHVLGYKQQFGKKVTGSFLTYFGEILENYVIDLARNALGEKNIVSANDIVTVPNEDRCEVVCYYEDKTLALEVKKLNFQRDAVSEGNTKHIEDTFERHFPKAVRQIINTMNYLEGHKFGLIVIPDTMLSPSSALEPFKQSVPEFNAIEHNILVCTLSEYEKLMANSPELIFMALDKVMKRSFQEGRDISLLLEDMKQNGESVKLINPYINKTFDEKLKAQEKKLSLFMHEKTIS